MKTETWSISEFMHRKEEPFSAKVERHFKKYGTVYKVIGITTVLLISGGAFDFAFATDSIPAMATSGIDVEAKNLYRELVGIGKWFIVFKGGFNVIKSVGNGDFDAAKSSFFSSVLIYLILLALPYGLDKVDSIFNKISVTTSGGM